MTKVMLVFHLLLLFVAAWTVNGDVSKEDIDKILKGVEAGKDFSKALSKPGFKSFTASLKKMNDIIGPWVDGIGLFSSVLGLFLPKDNEVLDEMKKGFSDVNKRLDDIKEGLQEVKEAIDWAVVRVNFIAIESQIRKLDIKLTQAIISPSVEDGKNEFIRVYEHEYFEAGNLLWDAIVKNDQVFYKNIVKAGMEYTDYYRAKMTPFMTGLIALIMKAANIEVAYEAFKEQDRGMREQWKTKLLEVQKSLETANGVLEYSWVMRFNGEVDTIAKDSEGESHETFSEAVYAHLNAKYSWNYWFILSYDPITGRDKQAIVCDVSWNCHVKFRYYGRSYVIGTGEEEFKFDIASALETVKRNIECPQSLSVCKADSAIQVATLAKKHGVLRAVIQNNKASFYCMRRELRGCFDSMSLTKGTWTRSHWQFQFG